MAIDRDSFRESFIDDYDTKWLCPVCRLGVLTPDAKLLVRQEAPESGADRKHQDWDPSWEHGKFSCLLRCNRKHCSEVVSTCGSYRVNDYEDNEGIPVNLYEYYPKYFDPPLKLLNLPSGWPKEVCAPIEEAFSVFWCDKGSAVNHIRSSIEALLTTQNIPQYALLKKGSKRSPLSLHKRIERFRVQRPELADLLLAAKWIGNEGSHTGIVERSDIFDALDLVYHVLEEVLGNRTVSLQKLSKVINKGRKPRSKKANSSKGGHSVP